MYNDVGETQIPYVDWKKLERKVNTDYDPI